MIFASEKFSVRKKSVMSKGAYWEEELRAKKKLSAMREEKSQVELSARKAEELRRRGHVIGNVTWPLRKHCNLGTSDV